MIRVVAYIVLMALAASGIAWLADRPGGVILSFGEYRVETSLAVAALGVAVLAIALALVWSLLRFILRIPSLFGYARRARRKTRGYEAVTRGMIAVGSGDQRLAKRAAEDARRYLGNEPLSLLLDAQAAQMSGDRSRAEAAFRAMLTARDTKVLGLRGLFVEATRRGDGQAALQHAKEASRLAPNVAWAGEAVLEQQCANNDWEGALSTLERAASSLERDIYRRQRAVLLTASGMQKSATDQDTALSQAREALKLAPDLVPAAEILGTIYTQRGDLRKAAKALEAVWKLVPHPDLARLYLHIRHGDSSHDRLARAERLFALRPDSNESRLTLARSALEAREFERVHAVMQPLLASRPTTRACLLMAEVEDKEHGDSGQVREWLHRATHAPRDEAWIADGVISDHWAPISPVTGHLDAFRWTRPVESINRSADWEQGFLRRSNPTANLPEASTPPTLAPASPEEKTTSNTPPEAPDDIALPASAAPVMNAAPANALEAAPSDRRSRIAHGPASEVIFPLAASPDDPGPNGPSIDEPSRPFRLPA